MKHNFMAAIEVNADNGAVIKGNVIFDIDGPLTAIHIENVKKQYCSKLINNKGVMCSFENAVIYAVIPLGG